ENHLKSETRFSPRERPRHSKHFRSRSARRVKPHKFKCASIDRRWLGNSASVAPGKSEHRQVGDAGRERAHFDLVAKWRALCKRGGVGPLHCCRTHDYLTVASPDLFSVARRNSLGNQSLDPCRTYFDARPRLAVRHGRPLTSGEPAR